MAEDDSAVEPDVLRLAGPDGTVVRTWRTMLSARAVWSLAGLVSFVLATATTVFIASPSLGGHGGSAPDSHGEAHRSVDREQLCQQPPPRIPFTPPKVEATTLPSYDDKLLLQRPVICILQNKHYRDRLFYHAAFTPFEYCTYVVLQFFHVTTTNPTYRTSHDVHFLRSVVNASRTRPKKLRGQSNVVPVLLGLGVDESDSARFHHMVVADSEDAFVGAAMVHIVMDNLGGVHVNWLYPGPDFKQADRDTGAGDWCGDTADKYGLLDLLHKFRASLPSPAYTLTATISTRSSSKNYDLQGILDVVDYAVVYAPDSYLTIGCYFNRTTVAAAIQRLARKTSSSRQLCYAMRLSASTFVAPVAALGARASGPGPEQRASKSTGRAAHFELCDASWMVDAKASTGECTVAVKRRPVAGGELVAAYETVQNLKQRFDLSFADGIGSQCVAVYDLEFDDYLNRCKRGYSPHLRTVATDGMEDTGTQVYAEIL